MYQFRINHNNFPSTKFYFGYPPIETLQLTMISLFNISESCKMKPWQWKFHHNSSEYIKKQMGSFVTFLHHSNCLLTHCLAVQLCMSIIELVSLPDVHYRLEKAQMSVCLLNSTKCLDFNNSTLSSNHHNYPHLPRRNNEIH